MRIQDLVKIWDGTFFCKNSKRKWSLTIFSEISLLDIWHGFIYIFGSTFLINERNNRNMSLSLLSHFNLIFKVANLPLTDEKLYFSSRSFKTVIYGTFVWRMRKDVSYYCDKNHDERLVLKSEYPLCFAIRSYCTKLSWTITFALSLRDM